MVLINRLRTGYRLRSRLLELVSLVNLVDSALNTVIDGFLLPRRCGLLPESGQFRTISPDCHEGRDPYTQRAQGEQTTDHPDHHSPTPTTARRRDNAHL